MDRAIQKKINGCTQETLCKKKMAVIPIGGELTDNEVINFVQITDSSSIVERSGGVYKGRCGDNQSNVHYRCDSETVNVSTRMNNFF